MTSSAEQQWLLSSTEPWTRYRTLIDLCEHTDTDPEVKAVRAEMLRHPQILHLIETAASWPGYALKRHNDARHPLYAFSTLADFGVRHNDPGMETAVAKVFAHQAGGGAFETYIRFYKRFGGLDGEYWHWLACDAPTLLYALVAMGLGEDARVQQAATHLVELVERDGWGCRATAVLGDFSGPGRKNDPCPIVNVIALKALSLLPELHESPAVRSGVQMLLYHWQVQAERKIRMFGIGTDFRKLKYPFVWYDILHVVEVLSRFPFVHQDHRFQEMMSVITAQADGDGRFTASSMYRAWQGWSFADKKHPSPWLTFLVARILHRQTRVLTHPST